MIRMKKKKRDIYLKDWFLYQLCLISPKISIVMMKHRRLAPVNYMIIRAHLIGKYSNFLGIIKADSFRSRNLFLSSLKKILVKALLGFGDPLNQ